MSARRRGRFVYRTAFAGARLTVADAGRRVDLAAPPRSQAAHGRDVAGARRATTFVSIPTEAPSS
jgi:hypothetical protein